MTRISASPFGRHAAAFCAGAFLLSACSNEEDTFAVPTEPETVSVAQITSVEVGVTPDGVLVLARGADDRRDLFAADLRPLGAEGDLLRFSMQAQSGGQGGQGALTAARAVTERDLIGIARIAVEGDSNRIEAAMPQILR